MGTLAAMRPLAAALLLLCLAAAPATRPSDGGDAEAARRVAWDFTAALLTGDTEAAGRLSDLPADQRSYVDEFARLAEAKRAWREAVTARFGPEAADLNEKPIAINDEPVPSIVAVATLDVEGDAASLEYSALRGSFRLTRRDGRWVVTDAGFFGPIIALNGPTTAMFADVEAAVEAGEVEHPSQIVPAFREAFAEHREAFEAGRERAEELGRQIAEASPPREIEFQDVRVTIDGKRVDAVEAGVTARIVDGDATDSALDDVLTELAGERPPATRPATRPRE